MTGPSRRETGSRRRTARRAFAALIALGMGGVALLGHAPGSVAAGDDGAPEEMPAIRPLLFGVVPQQSATRLASLWGPLIGALSAELGRPVQFATTRDIPTFEACLAAGRFDIAYMNPHHYVVFSREAGYRVVANRAGAGLRGLLVMRRGSGIGTLEALDGTRIAFPSAGAFGASVLPQAEMARRGIAFTPIYARSHDSVYRAVAAGLVAAGGGVRRTLDAAHEDLRDALEVIYTTDPYTPHAIAVLGDAAAEAGTALFATTARDPALLAALGMGGLRAAVDADYDDVRTLDITPGQAGQGPRSEATCPFG